MNNLGTTTIETDRLVLRRIELSDAQDLAKLLSDKSVLEYLPGIPTGYTTEMAKGYITKVLEGKYKDNTFYDWAIAEKGLNRLVGRITVYKQDQDRRMADLVWYVMPECRGKGFVTEAAKAVVKYLQDVGFERIEAFANIENSSSQRVMEKAGFQCEGVLRKYDLRRDGTLYDAKMYSVIKERDR